MGVPHHIWANHPAGWGGLGPLIRCCYRVSLFHAWTSDTCDGWRVIDKEAKAIQHSRESWCYPAYTQSENQQPLVPTTILFRSRTTTQFLTHHSLDHQNGPPTVSQVVWTGDSRAWKWLCFAPLLCPTAKAHGAEVCTDLEKATHLVYPDGRRTAQVVRALELLKRSPGRYCTALAPKLHCFMPSVYIPWRPICGPDRSFCGISGALQCFVGPTPTYPTRACVQCGVRNAACGEGVRPTVISQRLTVGF